MEAAFTLPDLPYAYDVRTSWDASKARALNPAPQALEPAISQQIMELHHSKHHQTYVDNLNNALKAQALALSKGDIPAQIDNQQAIKFNGGGHINHSLFWRNLAPAKSQAARDPQGSASQLVGQIDAQFGGLDQLKAEFNKALLGLQGSGWGWLVKEDGARGPHLRIMTTKDQDPVPAPLVPILGVDMWEHAYYLQYLNGKAQYLQNIWTIINWETAEERYCGGRADSLRILGTSM